MAVAVSHNDISDYYGRKLQKSGDLKTTACSAAKSPHPILRELMGKIPSEISAQFYGCGAPVPLGIEGRRVLDLGCGSGRDCYLASALVGEDGAVIGIDMTSELLDVAKAHVEKYSASLGYSKSNMRFVEGRIEDLRAAAVDDGSIDLIISNCVINLCPDKDKIFSEAYRVLAPGGEMHFSDMYATTRLSAGIANNQELWGEGVTGAQYREDFISRAIRSGFTAPRILNSAPVVIIDKHIKEMIAGTEFVSETYRLFKLPGLLERTEEDYGQLAQYKGNVKGCEKTFELDASHAFPVGKPVPVSGNTAAMVGEGGVSWLSSRFKIIGTREQHNGPFVSTDCTDPANYESEAGDEARDENVAGDCPT